MPLKYNTWTNFYKEKRAEKGPFDLLVFQEKMTVFNKTLLDHINSMKALKLTIASSTFNFLLIPGPKKMIQLVHNVMLVPQVLWETNPS
jgi:hypothetical protein